MFVQVFCISHTLLALRTLLADSSIWTIRMCASAVAVESSMAQQHHGYKGKGNSEPEVIYPLHLGVKAPLTSWVVAQVAS